MNETIIYAYRVTSDKGNAPCIYDLKGRPTGILSLSCCKGGQIRHYGTDRELEVITGLRNTIGKKHKEEIDIGMGEVFLMGIYRGKLLYFAKITKVLDMYDYFINYKNRLDSIYTVTPSGFERNSNNKNFHPIEDVTQHKKDWLGRYALISNIFAYWGKECYFFPPNIKEILPKRQESKAYSDKSPEGQQIIGFVNDLWDFNSVIQKEPHDYAPSKNYKGCAGK